VADSTGEVVDSTALPADSNPRAAGAAKAAHAPRPERSQERTPPQLRSFASRAPHPRKEARKKAEARWGPNRVYRSVPAMRRLRRRPSAHARGLSHTFHNCTRAFLRAFFHNPGRGKDLRVRRFLRHVAVDAFASGRSPGRPRASCRQPRDSSLHELRLDSGNAHGVRARDASRPPKRRFEGRIRRGDHREKRRSSSSPPLPVVSSFSRITLGDF
jgi:hypothetical protein